MTFAPKLTLEYRYWECARAAAAVRTDKDRADIWRHCQLGYDPLDSGIPQCGYFKMRSGPKGKERWAPVGIWKEGDVIMARGAGRDDPEGLWLRSRTNPISYEDYTHAVNHGSFPGEVEAALPKLDNYAEDPNADYREQMVSLLAQVEAFLKTLPDPITDEGANALANYRDLLNASARTAKDLLDKEIAGKKAEIAQKKEVWDIPMKAAVDITDRIRKLITPFLIAKKAKGEETRIGGQGIAGKRARRTGLKSIWKARITDWDLAVPAFAEHPQVRALIEMLANAAARSKELRELPIDGVDFYEEDSV